MMVFTTVQFIRGTVIDRETLIKTFLDNITNLKEVINVDVPMDWSDKKIMDMIFVNDEDEYVEDDLYLSDLRWYVLEAWPCCSELAFRKFVIGKELMSSPISILKTE